ncbi:MAG: twin-arginine translocase subunit TatC [Gammaproteobacteria bacterium]
MFYQYHQQEQSQKAVPQEDYDDREQSFISHLLELRHRIILMLVGVFAVFIVLVPFSNALFHYLAHPILAALGGKNLISVGTMSPFLVPLKFTLFLSIFIAIPWLLYQIWAFVAPGLYRHEKRLVMPLVVSSTVLFYFGMAFAYFVVLKLFALYMTKTAPAGVDWVPDIDNLLNFVLALFIAFGVAFEVPVATILLCLIGVTTPDAMLEKRPYIVVGAFFVAAIMTPPDVISQIMMAIPMWLLFEAGVILARVLLRRKEEGAGHMGADNSYPRIEDKRDEGSQK